MPLRELLFGASVDTVVPTTFMVGPTLATILHTVGPVPATRLQDIEGGRAHLSSDDPDLVSSLHAWFDAQLSDHGADTMDGHMHHR
jgi:hypothetical protein